MAAPKRSGVRIDMTPMVDVAFLLLIFFMSTTQFRPPEKIAVQLPTSASEIHVPETGTIILTVNREGKFFISSEKGTDLEEVPRENMLNAILAWRGRNPSAVVILKGDRQAPFGPVSDVMNALADAKTLRFNLMTDLKTRGKARNAAAPGSPGASTAPAGGK